jgi:lipoate-protein ligase A
LKSSDKGTAVGGRWRLLRERGPAASLHAAAATALNERPLVRTVRFVSALRPALVLGSHQPAETFDPVALRAAGLDLARRQSGGSAVLVGRGEVLWVDLLIPSGDPLWDDDVARAAGWVGELWASAIGTGQVWTGPMRTSAWSKVVCFAGLGPGEVTVDGRKVVGVSQRRTPRGALFQTAGLLEWRPEQYASLLTEPVGDPSELAESATGLGSGAAERIESALLALLMP